MFGFSGTTSEAANDHFDINERTAAKEDRERRAEYRKLILKFAKRGEVDRATLDTVSRSIPIAAEVVEDDLRLAVLMTKGPSIDDLKRDEATATAAKVKAEPGRDAAKADIAKAELALEAARHDPRIAKYESAASDEDAAITERQEAEWFIARCADRWLWLSST